MLWQPTICKLAEQCAGVDVFILLPAGNLRPQKGLLAKLKEGLGNVPFAHWIRRAIFYRMQLSLFHQIQTCVAIDREYCYLFVLGAERLYRFLIVTIAQSKNMSDTVSDLMSDCCLN